MISSFTTGLNSALHSASTSSSPSPSPSSPSSAFAAGAADANLLGSNPPAAAAAAPNPVAPNAAPKIDGAGVCCACASIKGSSPSVSHLESHRCASWTRAMIENACVPRAYLCVFRVVAHRRISRRGMAFARERFSRASLLRGTQSTNHDQGATHNDTETSTSQSTAWRRHTHARDGGRRGRHRVVVVSDGARGGGARGGVRCAHAGVLRRAHV